MRLNKKTIKHTCLGCLHAIAICLPILASIFRLGYVWFNKNAKDSYSGNNEIVEVLPINSSLSINKQYYFNTDSNILSQSYNTIVVYSNSDVINNGNVVVKKDKLVDFRLLRTNTNYVLIHYYNDENIITTLYSNFSIDTYVEFSFSVGANVTIDSEYNNYIKEISTNVENTLDNAFYYSTKQTLKDFHYYSDNMSSDYSTYVSNLQSYFVVNVDYLSLFGVNPSSDYLYYVAINFMLNYLVTIELVLLAPEIFLVFFELIRKLMFGLLDKTDERSY